MAKIWKHPNCPLTDEWIKKMWSIYTVKHSAIKKNNKILPFETNGIMLSEISQTEKDKYHIISFIS